MKQCPICNTYVDDYARFCSRCGHDFTQGSSSQGSTPPPVTPNSYGDNAFDCGPEGKSRGIAALLAIFAGYFGIQYFYLGKVQAGIICIILSFVTCGIWEIVMFIQGIVMLCMTNTEFRNKYVLTNSSFPLF